MLYVVYCKDYDKIKIGYSDNPEKRLPNLAVAHWSELKLAFYEEGELEEEQFIHELLKSYNLRGEWYTYKDIKHLFPYLFRTWNKTDCIHNLIEVKDKLNLEVKLERQTELKIFNETTNALDKLKLNRKPKYTDLFKTYIDLLDKVIMLDKQSPEAILIQEEIKTIDQAYKEFSFAVSVLGSAKIKALNYQKSKVKKELDLTIAKEKTKTKVIELLKYDNNTFVSANDVKNQLQTIYNQLDINTKVCGTSIQEYYKVISTKKRFNKKVIRGFEILYPL